MSNKKQKQVIGMVALVGLVGVGAGVVTYLSLDKDKDNKHSDTVDQNLSGQLLTYTINGEIKLLNANEGKELHTFDLKSLTNDTDGEMLFTFSQDELFNYLVAYNDMNKTFYKVEALDNQIEVTPLYENKELSTPSEFKLINDSLYVLVNDGNKILEIELENNIYKEFELEGKAELFTVKNEFFYYTFDNQLGKLDLENNEVQHILLGDKSLDYAFSKDKLYVLNQFGTGLNNSILMKIDLESLSVDEVKELKSKQNTILNQNVEDLIYVGQLKETVNEEGEVTKSAERVLRISPEKFNTKSPLKEIPYDKSAVQFDNYIYEVNDDKAMIYSASNGNVLSEFDIEKSVRLMPLK